jgi:hypothetical protein
MDEDRFNMSIRKFLKAVGVTSQREIEIAVRKGTPKHGTKLKAKMVLTIPDIGLHHEIDGDIETG